MLLLMILSYRKLNNVFKILRMTSFPAVGNLKIFSSFGSHHVAKHGFDSDLFTPENRPHCLKGRYSLCQVTPVNAMRCADAYRKDGHRCSNFFKLWPIVLEDHQPPTPDMNKCRNQASTFSLIHSPVLLLEHNTQLQ